MILEAFTTRVRFTIRNHKPTIQRMIVESSRTQQRPADVLDDVEAVRKLPRALKRKSGLHCCEGVFMSDIAFNPKLGSKLFGFHR